MNDKAGTTLASPLSAPPLAAIGPMSRRVLVVDDDPTMCEALRVALQRDRYETIVAHTLAEAEEALGARAFDAVFLDVFLGEERGLELLSVIRRVSPFAKVLAMTAQGSIDMAVAAMQGGVSSFVTKSRSPTRLVDDMKELLGSMPGEMARPDELGLVGRSVPLQQVVTQIYKMKNVDSTVLVTGESGTGKEVVARALHSMSQRRSNFFAAINCGAIPETLLEAELFGHRKGAFTDAKADRKGIFELCSDGTLLLDEIGDMPMGLQIKLLRVLQEREITPIGASQSIKINTRVIAATNRNLEDEVKGGRFREDLYFRLTILKIAVPSLKAREDDIPLLVEHFVRKFNTRFDKSVRPPSHELLARLKAHHWPGNIRELQNAIERGVVLTETEQLSIEQLFGRKSDVELKKRNEPAATSRLMTLTEAKENFEKSYLKEVLAAANGNISDAARLCGRYRTDIYRLTEKYGLSLADFRS